MVFLVCFVFRWAALFVLNYSSTRTKLIRSILGKLFAQMRLIATILLLLSVSVLSAQQIYLRKYWLYGEDEENIKKSNVRQWFSNDENRFEFEWSVRTNCSDWAGKIGQNSSQARVLWQQNIVTFMIAVILIQYLYSLVFNEQMESAKHKNEHDK